MHCRSSKTTPYKYTKAHARPVIILSSLILFRPKICKLSRGTCANLRIQSSFRNIVKKLKRNHCSTHLKNMSRSEKKYKYFLNDIALSSFLLRPSLYLRERSQCLPGFCFFRIRPYIKTHVIAKWLTTRNIYLTTCT